LLFLIASFYVIPATAQDKGLPGAAFPDLKYTGQDKVVQIISPLTRRLHDGRLIRLSGLDFPDYNPDRPGNMAVTAVEILRDMLEGKDVNIYQTERKNTGRLNRMGHHIAHLERKEDGAWVQGSLLSLGLARVRTSPRNPEMAPQMYALEEKARAEKLGLWEIGDFKVLSPEEAENKTGSFRIVEGRIESVSLKQNRIYINFGLNWRDDFTVSIPPASRRAFSKAGLDPLQWNGKTIRARGWLESYNGPYIEIGHPQAIEILNNEQASENTPARPLQESSQGPMVRSIDANP